LAIVALQVKFVKETCAFSACLAISTIHKAPSFICQTANNQTKPFPSHHKKLVVLPACPCNLLNSAVYCFTSSFPSLNSFCKVSAFEIKASSHLVDFHILISSSLDFFISSVTLLKSFHKTLTSFSPVLAKFLSSLCACVKDCFNISSSALNLISKSRFQLFCASFIKALTFNNSVFNLAEFKLNSIAVSDFILSLKPFISSLIWLNQVLVLFCTSTLIAIFSTAIFIIVKL
jgi:hypothetical protein